MTLKRRAGSTDSSEGVPDTGSSPRSLWKTFNQCLGRYVTLNDRSLFQECKFRVHARRQSRHRLTILLLSYGTLVLLFWPTDFFLFDSREVIRVFSGWRVGTFLAMGILLGLVYRVNLVKERSYWFLTGYLCLYFAVTGYLFGEVRGLSFPWFYIAYIIPMFSIPAAVDLLPRFIGSILVPLSYVGAYLYNAPGTGLYPDLHQFIPLTGSALFLFTMIGHSIYYLDRANFFQSRLVKKQRQRLRRLARRDQLTGLLNRREFEARYGDKFSRANRYGHDLTVMMADLDHFKDINDVHGHQAGDRVLETVGKVLRDMTRKGDIEGRYGGEEFVVALPETGCENARRVAERIKGELAQRRFQGKDGKTFGVTCSIGLATMNDDDPESLIQRADDALYHAKKGGRNRVATA